MTGTLITLMEEAFGPELFALLEQPRMTFVFGQITLDPWSDDGIRDFMLNETLSELCVMIRRCNEVRRQPATPAATASSQGEGEEKTATLGRPKKYVVRSSPVVAMDENTTVEISLLKRQTVEDALRYVKLWIRYFGFLPGCLFEVHNHHSEHRSALAMPPAIILASSPLMGLGAADGSSPLLVQPSPLGGTPSHQNNHHNHASPGGGGGGGSTGGGKRSLPSLETALSTYDQLNQILAPCQLQVAGSTIKKEEGRPSGNPRGVGVEGLNLLSTPAGVDHEPLALLTKGDADPSRALFDAEIKPDVISSSTTTGAPPPTGPAKKDGGIDSRQENENPFAALDNALLVMSQLLQDIVTHYNHTALAKSLTLERFTGREIGFLLALFRGLVQSSTKVVAAVVVEVGGDGSVAMTPGGGGNMAPATAPQPRIVETKAPNKEALLIDVRSLVFQKLEEENKKKAAVIAAEQTGGVGGSVDDVTEKKTGTDDDDDNRLRTRARRPIAAEKEKEDAPPEKPKSHKRQVGKKETREQQQAAVVVVEEEEEEDEEEEEEDATPPTPTEKKEAPLVQPPSKRVKKEITKKEITRKEITKCTTASSGRGRKESAACAVKVEDLSVEMTNNTSTSIPAGSLPVEAAAEPATATDTATTTTSSYANIPNVMLSIPPEVQLFLHLGPLFQDIHSDPAAVASYGQQGPDGDVKIPLVPGTTLSAVPTPAGLTFEERCILSFEDAHAAQHPNSN